MCALSEWFGMSSRLSEAGLARAVMRILATDPMIRMTGLAGGLPVRPL